LTGYSASAAGALLAGVPTLLGQPGFLTYRPLFFTYLASGILGALIYSRLSSGVELDNNSRKSSQVLSEKSKRVVFKFSTLFAVDAFGGGLVGTSIISLYFYTRYSLDPASLGILVAITQVITATSLLVAARLANRIGLLKTMVYSHIPSNILLTLIPFAPSVSLAIGLLFSRQSLSQMDVPTRQSLLASLIPKSDRTAAAGITNVTRTASTSASPFLTGYIMENVWLGLPFALAGTLKIVYDILVYRTFHRTPVVSED
jgi:MFS family permease